MSGKRWEWLTQSYKRNSMVSDIRPMHCLQLGVLQQLSRLCLESLNLLGAVGIVGESSYPKGTSGATRRMVWSCRQLSFVYPLIEESAELIVNVRRDP